MQRVVAGTVTLWWREKSSGNCSQIGGNRLYEREPTYTFAQMHDGQLHATYWAKQRLEEEMMIAREVPETVEAKVKAKLREVEAKLRRLPNVDLYADRLSSDPRLGLMMAGRSAGNLRRAPVFRSSRVA